MYFSQRFQDLHFIIWDEMENCDCQTANAKFSMKTKYPAINIRAFYGGIFLYLISVPTAK